MTAVATPLTAAIVAVVTQVITLIVSFGIINDYRAGIAISITVAAVNVGALIYAAVSNHSKAVVTAAKISSGK